MAGCLIPCPKCSEKIQIPTLCEAAPVQKEVNPAQLLNQVAPLPKTAPKDLQLKPTDGRAQNLATASFVLGIFSIMAAILISGFVAITIVLSKKFDMLIFHFVSFALGIGAIILANKAKLIGTWSSAGSTQGYATAGRICGIIGITIALALSIFMI